VWATVALVVTLATTVLAGVSGAAPAPVLHDATRIELAREKALTDSFQPEIPAYAGSDGSGARGSAHSPDRRPGDDHRRMQRIDTRAQRDGAARDPGPIGTVISYLMWGLIAIAVALGAFWVAGELFHIGRDADAPPEEADAEAAAIALERAVVDRPLGDAEELARRGEFGEAIHTLLLRTLQELAKSSAVRVAPATTSREILARVALLADAREALAGLIVAVEVTHFGGGIATADDYARCREQFQRFAVAFRARGKA
jgi:hypothetical protein